MASPNGQGRRPSTARHPTAPSVIMNGHFASSGNGASNEQYERGVQVVSGDKEFNTTNLPTYLNMEKVTSAGFNYHLISVFGSQSTGKSTLLNHLFGTEFGVMDENDRRQTTKGIWLSKNKKENADGGGKGMAENILVMDVEGTDGRERGEDQDFERKSALFALATSEVLMVNMWEHQVGLYQGANMSLLKTVFEVNLQLFLKDRKSVPRSLLYFVIRDHIGNTPLANLRNTLLQDLSRIWSSLSKPPGLEKSKIQDYFDFAFVALPHKILQPEKFVSEIRRMGTRFVDGHRDPKRSALQGTEESGGILLPEYHRRIPADGFSMYASNVWEQIDSNKDLDLPTQQEMLAQFRCDEIAREVLIPFDERIVPLEEMLAENTKVGRHTLLPELGAVMKSSRATVMEAFQTEGSRYHKGVFTRKRDELQSKVDGRLRALFQGQLNAAHKKGVDTFGESVSEAVRQGQKRGSNYDFAQIVETEKARVLALYEREAKLLVIEGASWSDYKQQLALYRKDLDESSARLRKDEMRRLANRVERLVKTKLAERVGLEFNSLGSGRAGGGAPVDEEKPPTEKDLWDRVWKDFTEIVEFAEERFTDKARGFDASPEEVEVGLWRLRRKSWSALRAKIEDEVMEGNILLKLRENFEDKFRYDSDGVPRIWRPTDDIETIYTTARQSTLTLIPLLCHFKLFTTSAPPPLDAWIGQTPPTASTADEEDLPPIGGLDSDESAGTLADETTILSNTKAADLATRFRKTADGVFVEAKRSAVGGVAQVPLYFYGLLLALGWNELVAVLKNPLYFVFLLVLGVAAYVTYSLNMWGPMLRMADGATRVALEEGKARLREFLEAQEGGGGGGARRAVAVDGDGGGRKGRGKKDADEDGEEDGEI